MINEQSFDYRDVDAVVELINELCPDEGMKRILFSYSSKREMSPKVLGRDMIDYVWNIISMAFVLVYTRWKYIYDGIENGGEKMSGEIAAKFKNSRYSNVFVNLKDYEEIKIEIMVFSLTEVWVATRCDTDINDLFQKFFSGDVYLGVLLDNARRALRIEEETSRDMSAAEKNKMVCDLLEAFEIFSVISMPGDGEDYFEFVYKLNPRTKVRLCPNAVLGPEKFICHEGWLEYRQNKAESVVAPPIIYPYLRYAISEFNGEHTLCYRTFNESRDCTYYDLPYAADGGDADADIRHVDKMRQFLAFDYRKLRDFALVLSDAVNEFSGYKTTIFNEFSGRFKSIFIDREALEEGYSWDNIFILLLVELGPSELFNVCIDETLFKTIMDNIRRRYLDRSTYDVIMRNYHDAFDKLNAAGRYQEHFFGVNHKRLMSHTITEAMRTSEDVKPKHTDYCKYEQSLATKYDKVRVLIDKLKVRPAGGMFDPKERELARKELEQTLCDVLSFIEIFYAGIDGYAAHSSLAEFVNSARKKRKEISGLPLTGLYEQLLKQCQEYNSDTSNGGYQLKAKALRLKKVITRTYICDVKKLMFYVGIKAGDKDTNIFEFVENMNTYTVFGDLFNEWLDYILDFFIFLVFNDDCSCRHLVDDFEKGVISEKEIDPIYPYVVSYLSSNIDRDKVKRCVYRAYVPAKYTDKHNDGDGLSVTLLTEHEYENDANYYCMPLKYGATGKWWIDPFMIPTSVFSEILKDEE